jgi:hypothetical protein
MRDKPDKPYGEPAANRIRAAQAEIEALLRQLVHDEALKVFAYRWGSQSLDSGRLVRKLNLYFEDQAKCLSFDCRDLLDREPGFWKRNVPSLICREMSEAST